MGEKLKGAEGPIKTPNEINAKRVKFSSGHKIVFGAQKSFGFRKERGEIATNEELYSFVGETVFLVNSNDIDAFLEIHGLKEG
ncbi:MAG: hypothetical protein CM15mP58_21520 [Burkholderiaceae bacterium]|nr:MAG: hypothetical protein CM15mP58_21520 [Burkholderiaceae bacterium]